MILYMKGLKFLENLTKQDEIYLQDIVGSSLI